MKKGFLALLAVTLLIACNPSKPKTIIIEGDVPLLPDSTEIRLSKWQGDLGFRLMTDTVINGKFYFEIESDSVPALYSLYINDNNFSGYGLDFWAYNNKTVIKGNTYHPRTWEVKSNLPEQKELYRYLLASKNELDQLQSLSIERNKLFDKSRSEAVRKRFEEIDSLSAPLDLQMAYNNVDIISKTKISPISLKQLRSASYYVNEDSVLRQLVIQQYDRLSEEEKQSIVGEAIEYNLYPVTPPVAGDKLRDAKLYDLGGNERMLAEIAKGKYRLFDFWSVGCGPCHAAIPEMKEIAAQYEGILEIVGINVDTHKDVWKQVSEEKEMTWYNVSDGRGTQAGIAAKYGMRGMPYYLLVSPEGIIIDTWTGYGQGSLKEKISEHISLPNPDKSRQVGL